MTYRCVATSVAGFIQQIAVAYVAHGYHFYVRGRIPGHKDPLDVDAKLISKYDLDHSKWANLRRSRDGAAKVQYLRYRRFFLLLATHGDHRFFEDEARVIRDVRRSPIKFAGHAISYRESDGRSLVLIERELFKRLKQDLVGKAVDRSLPELESQFDSLRFVPYGPVQGQLLQLLRAVNKRRKTAGLAQVPVSCLQMRRKSLKVFEEREQRLPANCSVASKGALESASATQVDCGLSQE